MHELAHQWVGDHLTIARWRDIWLNEGFATYTEWLWSEMEGRDSAQEIFDFYANLIPADDPFWTTVIGHPQEEGLLFDIAIYYRGAMALQALRNEVGDDAVLPAPARLGAGAGRRSRHDRGVHRDGRAGDRAPARRPLRDVALHAGEARGHRDRSGAGRRGGERAAVARRRRRPGRPVPEALNDRCAPGPVRARSRPSTYVTLVCSSATGALGSAPRPAP